MIRKQLIVLVLLGSIPSIASIATETCPAPGGTDADVLNHADTVHANGVASATASNKNIATYEGWAGKTGAYNHNKASAGVKGDEYGAGVNAKAFTKGKAGVRTHNDAGVDIGVEVGYDVGVGVEAEVGMMTGAGVKIGAGVTAGADTQFGDGGKAGVQFGGGKGFGAGGKAGVDSKGSVVVEGEALGFGGGFSAGGDHLVGAKVKAFGVEVNLNIPKFW